MACGGILKVRSSMNIFQHRIGRIVSATLVALLVLAPAASAYAATLGITSDSANVTTGDIVTVTILVNSSDQAINTAEGILQFPTAVLQALSVDKSSSIFSIWVQDPTFSNTTGQVSFSAGLPNPGYQGSGGTVLTATFVAKHSGTATLSLSDASVRANDGLGTDVLTSAGTLQLTVTNPAAVAPPTVVTAPVTTTTHTTPTTTTTSSTPSDTTPPTITSSSFTYDATTGLLTVSAKAKDTGSGIANYSITLDNATTTSISPADFAGDPYQIPVHVSGSHTALLTVSDNDGNKTGVTGIFTVPVIGTPTLNALPTDLNSGSQLSVQGTAAPDDATVQIYISKNGAAPTETSVTPDTTGAFILLGPILQKGNYEVWAVGTSVGGIVSAPTEKMLIRVSDQALLSVGPYSLSLANVLLIFLLFSIGSFLVAALGWYKVYTYYRGRKQAVVKIQKDVHRALGVFKDDIEMHLDALENADTSRKLGAAESKLREDMKSNLADLEKYIDGEVS
jgi:Cohesin domain